MAKIAFLLESDFEDSEFQVPFERLKDAGHRVDVLGEKKGKALDGKKGKVSVKADEAIGAHDASEYDALVIPGGYSPDKLRMNKDAVAFVKKFAAQDRPMAVICHGPQLLIEAEVVSGKQMTSWPSVRKDLENAGATWVDKEVCVDGNLISSRKPEDVPAFTKAILERLGSAAELRA